MSENRQGGLMRGVALIAGLAGLEGAAGVTLAAAAAHAAQSPALATASIMLMIHAAAVLALAALSTQVSRAGAWRSAAGLMIAASSLFGGEVAIHTLTGHHLFPYAAPTGGSLTIASWLAIAVLAFTDHA